MPPLKAVVPFWSKCVCPSVMGMLVLILFLFAASGCTTSHEDRRKASSVTMPLMVEGNRPFVVVVLQKPGGPERSGIFWIDSGGGGFVVTERLARDLGLHWNQVIIENGEEAFARPEVQPTARIGGMPLKLEGGELFIALGKTNLLPSTAPGHADGLIPRSVLARYHVVLDYPSRQFTLANPGAIRPVGTALAMPVTPGQGFPRTEIALDDARYSLLLDTGASFSVISDSLLNSWASRHPEWPRYSGAHGEATTLGGQALSTLLVPVAHWGLFTIRDVGFISRRTGTFEDHLSKIMGAPVVGSLGGNVLKDFRVELDYPNQTLYLSVPMR